MAPRITNSENRILSQTRIASRKVDSILRTNRPIKESSEYFPKTSQKEMVLHAVVVVPTYNEEENVRQLITSIMEQKGRLEGGVRLSVLIVDDSSPDLTSQIVSELADKFSQVHLISGRKEGLGRAYMRGFKYAMQVLAADIVLEMDADFSHSPHDIPRLIRTIQQGYDFVIGSRYIHGGSIPEEWSLFRKMNSRIANASARHIAGLNQVRDCSGGFRAIRTDLLREIPFNQLSHGYGFQIGLLNEAIQQNASIKEVPIHFSERTQGQSKMRITDMLGFLLLVFHIRLTSYIGPRQRSKRLMRLLAALGLCIAAFLWFIIAFDFTLSLLVISVSTVLSVQGLFSLFWMLYAWEDPDAIEQYSSPKIFSEPRFSFTALIPARQEEKVLADTIRAVDRIAYPEELKETIVICRSDDEGTIDVAKKTITALGKNNIKLLIFDGFPINKPHGLNVGLAKASADVVTVFDAEDEPHEEIYQVINTLMRQKHYDVVQSGVQLMNYRKPWFATLNVLEYFFWFKSGLLFFSNYGHVTPLGGNTVFFKKHWLEMVGGWDEECLTEDAEIGIRLTLDGAKIGIVYDEKHVTQEETPLTMSGFIKQRTRWIQGFLQILLKGDWLELPRWKQRFFALYILLSSSLQALLPVYALLGLWVAFTQKLPVTVALISYIPFYLLFLQFIVYIIGLYEFTKAYRFPFPLLTSIKIIFVFFPYQLLITIAAFRAGYRLILQKNKWEKTVHENLHRAQYNSNTSTLGYAKISE